MAEQKTYNILAINPGHNGSVAFVSNGKLIYYTEEERLSRLKYDGNPFRAILQVLVSNTIDELVIGGTNPDLVKLPWTNEDAYTALVRKFSPNVKVTNLGNLHHLGHAAAAFYGSGFDTAAAIIVDGAGSIHTEDIDEQTATKVSGYETETIYACSYPGTFDAVYKRYSDDKAVYYNNGIQEFDNSVTITKVYEAVSYYLGFGFIEAGKTMGLAPYGKMDSQMPSFFVNGKGNKNLLIPRYPAGAIIDENRFDYLKRYFQPSEWHFNPDLIRDIDKNIAYHVQLETENMMYELIQKAIDITGESNIVISGGFGLNCVANYKYLKKFPNINFYIDPIAHDGGTAIGLAKYAWYQYSKSNEISKLNTLYLGLTPDYNSLSSLQQQVPNMQVDDVTPEHVVDLLINGNIVALFQSQSEGGPRALGNRSILFDSRNVNGKDIVNRVKKREWFRPFAGSVLEQDANEWFDMATLQTSPFMMYAVDVRSEKIDQIPAVCHVDNTCRVQTVSAHDNAVLFNLLTIFKEKTNVPVLLNTSFNLAGQPLVDSIVDAIVTLFNSDLDYVYLADIGKILSKK